MTEIFCNECEINLSKVLSIIESCANGVFREIGYGVSESVYEIALADMIRKEFEHSLKCPHAKKRVAIETVIPVVCDGTICGNLRSDLTLHWETSNKEQKNVMIELKATSTPIDEKALLQLLAYLRVTKTKRGVLINFTQKSALLFQAVAGIQERKKKRKLSDVEQIDAKNRLICIDSDAFAKEPIIQFCSVLTN